MKRSLPNKTNAPPGGWSYVVPETGASFTARPSLTALLGDVRAHYRAAGYDMPRDIEDRIEAFLCERLQGYCNDEYGRAPMTLGEQLAHTFHTVLQGTATLVSWLAGGSERVSQAQADGRASTCVTCPHNQEVQGCTGCNIDALHNLAAKIVGGRVTSSDASLRACNVCSCALKAKVWMPIATLWPHLSAQQKQRLPAFCWLVAESNALNPAPSAHVPEPVPMSVS